ncbi:MAG: hypothetical protein PHF20_08515 [Halothiobacillaceae bacterium]|nr:hypothetical protein [Halothiobacillaceae bacterium]
MNATPEIIDLKTPEGQQWATDYVHEKLCLLPVIVDDCRKAICLGDTRRLHAELTAINGLAEECAELLERCSEE